MDNIKTKIFYASWSSLTYKSFIQLNINYAITVWGCTSEQNIYEVYRTEQHELHVFNNYDYVNVEGINLVAKMKVMNVRQWRDYLMTLLMFNCIHDLAPDYLCNEIIMKFQKGWQVLKCIFDHCNLTNVFILNVLLMILSLYVIFVYIVF